MPIRGKSESQIGAGFQNFKNGDAIYRYSKHLAAANAAMAPAGHTISSVTDTHEMPPDATRVLRELEAGDATAAERLLPLVYGELRALAGSYFRSQRDSHTLQPTALVHEAFLRLIQQPAGQWQDRAHFFAVAATAMRQILTDYARRARSAKRGGEWGRVELSMVDAQSATRAQSDIVALDEALTNLKEIDARKHRVVELRFFGGLSMDEIARVLELSKTTIENEWRAARAWLGHALAQPDEGAAGP